MIILGVNAYHGDASAAIVVDGQLLAAVEEERLVRVKHWAGFPVEAIRYCLGVAGVTPGDVDVLAVNRQPRAHLLRKVAFALRRRPSWGLVRDRLRNAGQIRDVSQVYREAFKLATGAAAPRIEHVEHHVAHLDSAFLVSPWSRAAVVSVDGFGDFVGAMWGVGNDQQVQVADRVYFPHSLGLLYLALTQFLGFPHYGDEYKVMGLAAYGRPMFREQFSKLVQLLPEGRFQLGLDYFVHHHSGANMTWDKGAPTIGPVFSAAMSALLGPPRAPTEPITERHHDLAASLQAAYEDAFFHLLNHAQQVSGLDKLCLAGGCAMNSVANGKISLRTKFQQTYIPPAPGDAGGAVGAAFHVWNTVQQQPRSFTMESPYWGPEFSDAQIAAEIERSTELRAAAEIEHLDEQALAERTADALVAGNVVGWFQGRLEWGPRALGSRSILVDPRHLEMKDILNARIKRREGFRPFAPAILEEATAEYFEQTEPDPFMSRVYKVRPEKRAAIPTAVHVDGTGRLQTVRRSTNPRYWGVIDAFRRRTGVPIVINTSFNENEPIVHQPSEAIDCFLRTKMDVLVLGSYFCRKRPAPQA
ncbi:MAG: carbamoyltransferase [Planctomycetes bacterium]|nr:carbamoyltransferase [Planctomycetota bacterium]